jgi:hypothetical protein
VTLKNAWFRVAPRLIAASSRRGSIWTLLCGHLVICTPYRSGRAPVLIKAFGSRINTSWTE